MQQDFYEKVFGLNQEQANYVFKVIGNFLHLAVERYLQDKSFYTKQEFLEFLEKNLSKEQEASGVAKLSKSPALSELSESFGLLNYPMVFEIKINWKKKVNIITSNMTFVGFVTAGFVSYVFRSKYFWGYDKVLWSLNKYKTIVNMYTKIGHEIQEVKNVTKNQKQSQNKVYALCKNNFPTKFLDKKAVVLNYLGILKRFFEICEFYRVGQIKI